MLAFSSHGPKDSATFAGATGEFVWNLATWELREQMNLSSAKLPRGESEFGFAGLETAPTAGSTPPRSGRSRAAATRASTPSSSGCSRCAGPAEARVP
jgi:flavin reductase (DIM6/NTAB) family NADH-FMN oxidoreductase RutF